MNDPTRTNIENWLTYAEELGLAPFYRDRAITEQSNPKAAPAIEPAAEIPEPMPKPKQSSAPIATAQNKPAATFFPVAAGPTLFEAADRIQGDTLEIIRTDLGECTRCKLHKTRNKIVFGDGNSESRPSLRRRRPRPRRRHPRPPLRRPRRQTPNPNDRSHGPTTQRRLHLQRSKVPPPRKSHARAR